MSQTMLAAVLNGSKDKPRTNGAFCEYVLIGAEQCFPIPAHLDDGLAAMMEPWWEEAIRLVASGRANLRPLISRVFPLRQATEALLLACAKTGVVKVQLELNS